MEDEIDFSNTSDSIRPIKKKRITVYDNKEEIIPNNSIRLIKEDEWNPFLKQEPTLEEISKMVKELAATTSRKEKALILAKYPKCIKIHLYSTNPFWQYYVNSTRVRKTINNGDFNSHYKFSRNIFELLDMLKSRW